MSWEVTRLVSIPLLLPVSIVGLFGFHGYLLTLGQSPAELAQQLRVMAS